MIPKIAEAYENKNPGSKFEIAEETIKVCRYYWRNCPHWNVHRELKGKEKAAAGATGVRLVKTVVANDAVAVIVNESNPLSNSLKERPHWWCDQLDAVGGKSGGISGYTRNTSSGTYAFFQVCFGWSRLWFCHAEGNDNRAEVANNPVALVMLDWLMSGLSR